MMFASKTPRDLNPHAPFMTGAGTPPLCSCGWQGRRFDGPILADHIAEFDHVQHNQPNPILVAFRADAACTYNWPRAILIQDWIDVLDGFSNAWDSCAVDLDDVLDASTPWHRAHARRVLTRLAAQENPQPPLHENQNEGNN